MLQPPARPHWSSTRTTVLSGMGSHTLRLHLGVAHDTITPGPQWSCPLWHSRAGSRPGCLTGNRQPQEGAPRAEPVTVQEAHPMLGYAFPSCLNRHNLCTPCKLQSVSQESLRSHSSTVPPVPATLAWRDSGLSKGTGTSATTQPHTNHFLQCSSTFASP